MNGRKQIVSTAYLRDIQRTIRKGRRRFCSLALITLLGVMMFSGLQASCMDLRYSADRFFDDTDLRDLYIVSTLGLTEDDVNALLQVEGVEAAEMVYSLEETVQMPSQDGVLEFCSFSEKGMDVPYAREGSLPHSLYEIAITEKTAADTGLAVGDSIIVSEDTSEETEEAWQLTLHLVAGEYTVTAIVTDPTHIDNPFGAVSYRTDASASNTVYVLEQAFQGNYCTGIRIRVKQAAEQMCYSQSYEDIVKPVKTRITDEIVQAREEARNQEVIGQAQSELADAEAEVGEELEDARRKLEDAEQKLEEGRLTGEKKLQDAQGELNRSIASGERELHQGQEELRTRITDGQKQLEEARAQIEAAYSELQQAQDQLQEAQIQANKQFEASEAEILAGLATYESVPNEVKDADSTYQNLLAAQAQLQTERESGNAYFEQARSELEANYATLKAQEETIAKSEQELREKQAEAQAEIEVGRQQLEAGRVQGQTKINQGYTDLKNELASGQQEIEEGWTEYEEGKAEAEQKLADARQKIEELKKASWYVMDRSSISGYANIQSDADSIEAIGTVFPIVFLIVAILISLTTITRMVEEDRGLIGTYKSLGFSDREIRRKYLIYAGSASALGGILGTILAFLGLPLFIFTVFDVMYLLPGYEFHFVPSYGLAGPIVFLAGILLAAVLALKHELHEVPAALMRPLAPANGSRILLEKIKPLWKKLSFLQKVTARNLFRYKKRLFMTVFGIAGCTALMLFGFAIRDSVHDLSPRQYETAFLFDLMSVAEEDKGADMYAILDRNPMVADRLELMITSSQLENEAGRSTDATMMVVEDGADLSSYIHLFNSGTGELKLERDTIYVTRNAANVLGIDSGDRVKLKLADLQKNDIVLSGLTENYLGNYIYMTASTYRKYFEDYKKNAALVHLSGTKEEQIAFTKELKHTDGFLSVTGIAELEGQFSGAFMLINMVVAIVILMSAALAFVVLFTLATTNISERQRELATIKVLGFYDREVHLYINRETILLSAIGILLGMPLGRLFAQSLTTVLNLPSIYLAVSLKPMSYLYACVLDICFAGIVNWIIGKTMDRIDPVEALKSVE